MSSIASATASALQGIQACLRRMDKAAAVISGSGADVAAAPDATSPGGVPTDAPAAADVPGAMVDILIAQRAFSAQLRVLEAAGQMADEAVHLGESAQGR